MKLKRNRFCYTNTKFKDSGLLIVRIKNVFPIFVRMEHPCFCKAVVWFIEQDKRVSRNIAAESSLASTILMLHSGRVGHTAAFLFD